MTSRVEELLNAEPFTTPAESKKKLLLPAVLESMMWHYGSCELFRRWCEKQKFDPNSSMISELSDIPYLPVNIFKRLSLRTSGEKDVVRTLRSSGTSTQIPSTVVLDKTTRDRQMKALATSLKQIIGPNRRPFIVLDVAPSSDAASMRADLSARVAGMRGYLMGASKICYVMKQVDGVPVLDIDALQASIEEVADSGIGVCVIGYTFVLYQHVVRELVAMRKQLVLPDPAVLIHFGGWKKLENQRVGKAQLNTETASVFGIPLSKIYDIYGFTEQLGVIYPDDSEGMKRTPVFSEVIVRDPVTFEAVEDGETGLLEFITPLPHSYPGVAILTDDMGRILSRRTGLSGWCGTGFEIVGRAKNAEIRGCGDTLPKSVYQVE